VTLSTPTPAQLRALSYLQKARWATPAELGHAIAEGRTTRPGGMKEQGAGRLGGSIAAALVKLGLAEPAARDRDGFPAYRISSAGRAVLANLAEER